MRTAHASWSSVLGSALDALKPRAVLYTGATGPDGLSSVAGWCSANDAVVHAVEGEFALDGLAITPGLVLHRTDLLDALVRLEDLELVIVEASAGTGTLERALQLLERRALDGSRFPVVIVRDAGVEPLRAFVSRSGLGLAAIDGGDGLAALASSRDSARLRWLRKPATPDPGIRDDSSSPDARVPALENELAVLSEARSETELRARRSELALEVAHAETETLRGAQAKQRERIKELRARISTLRAELDAGADERLSLRTELAREIGAAGAHQAELADAWEAADQLAAELRRSTEALEAAQQRSAKLTSDRAYARRTLAMRTTELASARRTVKCLEAQLADWEHRGSGLDERVAELEASQAQLRLDADAQHQQAAHAEAQAKRHLDEALRDAERLDALRRRLVEERDTGTRLLEEASHERKVLAAETRRVAGSRSWRWGHRIMWLLAKLTFRKVRRESALDVMLQRLERPIELAPRKGGTQAEDLEEQAQERSLGWSIPLPDAALPRIATVKRVSVIVPVYNAHVDLERCVETLARNTTRDAEVVLIDDASTDPRIRTLLDTYAELENVRVLRNKENRGFTRTVNRGLAETQGDVVLLNSDTLVPPRWLENLVRTAYSEEMIGTVTPLSDNAGAFSAPVVGEANPLPGALSVDEAGRLVGRFGLRLAPETPTGSGFCMYIKRVCLKQTGAFDADSFPRGYGEENDFCMRAGRHGWRHVVDDTTYVLHRREASFGEEKQTLVKPARQKLDALHPDYTERVRAFVRSPEMDAARGNVRRALQRAPMKDLGPLPRLLTVVHEGGGGAPATNTDLMRGLADRWDCFAFTSNTQDLRLWRGNHDGLRQIDEWKLQGAWAPTQFTREDYRRIATSVLLDHAIELVHVRQLFKHTFDIPHVAAALDIPLVMSFHDFYLVCPTVHLLDEKDRFCGGECTPGDGACRIPSPLLAGLPPLKHRWVKEWQRTVAPVLAAADAAVTTSRHARDLFSRRYPELRGKRFEVIEHGRDLAQATDIAQPPGDGPARIVVPGNLDAHKGLHFLRQIKELDSEGALEFHMLGTVPSGFEDLGVQHGPYRRDEFEERLRELRPSFVGVFSITAETYCHTLSEAWGAGVPVVATDIGALGERVAARGGGVLVPHDDPRVAYERLRAAAGDKPAWNRLRAEAHSNGLPSVAEMAREYDVLYRTVLAEKRVLRPRKTSRQLIRHRPQVLRVDAVVPGRDGSFPGSTHVRVLRRLTHPGVRWKIDTRLLDPITASEEVRYDLALVQRTVMRSERVEPFLDRIEAAGIPLVVELDDDLFSLGDGDPDYGRDLSSLRRLAQAADLVTVSTETLRERLPDVRKAAVLPNMLDERLWFAEPLPAKASSTSGQSLRMLYMGTTTHAGDLAMLRPIVESLRRDAGIDATLSVIGGELLHDGPTWYSRVLIPPGTANYPQFVAWLRSQAGAWDVAVAPLAETPFNLSKSDLKFLEYSALGLAGVYSDLTPYHSCSDGETGLRVENDTGSWCEALAGLHASPELREELAANAQWYVRAERCLEHQAPAYLELLAGVAA